MTEKAFTGGTDPLVEDLGGGVHVPIVKLLENIDPTSTWEDAGYTLDASGNLKSETQVNSLTGAARTRTWTYTTIGSNVMATPGAWV